MTRTYPLQTRTRGDVATSWHVGARSWLLVGVVGLSAGCNGLAPGEQAPPPTRAPATLHRLTQLEYTRSVEVLLGESGKLTLPSDLEADTFLHGYTTIAGGELTISPRAAEQYEAAALSLANQVFGDPARRVKLTHCTPSEPASKLSSDVCVRRYAASLGLSAYRRPLAPEEIDRMSTLAQTTATLQNDVWFGLEMMTAAFLQSPHFLFRVERGEPEPRAEGGTPRYRYTSYEMASRLSYALWVRQPDDDLFHAAALGELTSAAGVRKQVQRMLNSPLAQVGVGRFFAEYLKLGRLALINKDRRQFPQFTPSLRDAMQQEIERIARDLALSPDSDLRDLLTTQTTYVNRELGAFYGLPVDDFGADEWRRVELPASSPRGGILTLAGMLALNAHQTQTSPTLRGRFIREHLLCQDVPPPPPGVTTSLPMPPIGQRQTLRQRLEQHRQDPVCAGCHALMDPIGLTLEHFDAIGAFRQEDDGLPIDASTEFEGQMLNGGRALGESIRSSTRLAECMARQLYRYGTGHLEIAEEQAQIEQLGRQFTAQGHRFRDLVADLLASDGFRYAQTPTAPAGGE